jgi:preprotein translocase subunit SecB
LGIYTEAYFVIQWLQSVSSVEVKCGDGALSAFPRSLVLEINWLALYLYQWARINNFIKEEKRVNETPAKPNSTAELKLNRLNIKSSVFEAASVISPEIATHQPVIDLQVRANVYPPSLPESTHEVVLTLQITAKHNGALLWRVQLQQAGCYALTGFTPQAEKAVVNGFCMNQIYPYACAEVSHLANQGGFGMVYLQPIDFAQQYQEQQSKEAANTKPASAN